MKQIDKESMSALAKLSVFLFVTGLFTLILMLTLSNGSFGNRTEYRAMFTDATGVVKGDDVRIAGVAVGAVKKVEIVDRDKALVTFAVDADTPLTANTNATLKFRNLVGQRYMALSQGASGAQSTLKKNDVIPLDRTQEALDLNVLLNGFKPVFQALSPDDTNKLAYEIVQTLQGESGNVETLLARTSSLTNTLAGRDQLIGDVIVNLSQVLDTVGSRDDELTETIDTLQQFVSGLKEDRNAILDSVDSIAALSNETADLLVRGRPALAEDIKQLNALTKNLSSEKNLRTLSDTIQILPFKMSTLGNGASSGSEFGFFLCEVKGQIVLPPIPLLGLNEETVLKVGGDSGVDLMAARCDDK